MSKFQHTRETIAPSIGGSYSALNDIQNFTIVSLSTDDKDNYLKRTEAQATFKYKNYVVSMSTSGLNSGACRTEVVVFTSQYTIAHKCSTVEEAIDWINQQ